MSVQERALVHPDITAENPPERAAHYLDVPNMPWEATKFPGIQIKVLCRSLPQALILLAFYQRAGVAL